MRFTKDSLCLAFSGEKSGQNQYLRTCQQSMLAAFEISTLIKNALPEVLSWTLDLICLALAISFCLQSF